MSDGPMVLPLSLPPASARFVIDTDAGVDDAVAIMLALHVLPRDAVLGITTVFGNVDLHQANHNVAHILDACGRTDVPVHSGASKPIIASISDERWGGHGPDGLGGIAGSPATASTTDSPLLTTARRNDAVHTLVDLAAAHSGDLVVIALGPLTNVALATLVDPAFVHNIRQLVVMGGTLRGEGNLTPHAEFNVGCDPEATSIVLQHCIGAPHKLLIVPYETCTDAALSWSVFDDVFPADSDHAHAQYIRRIWRHLRAYAPHEAFVPCDAYAMALLLHRGVAKEAAVVRGCIHLAPDERRGASIWTTPVESTSSQQSETANATLVHAIDTTAFAELLRTLLV